MFPDPVPLSKPPLPIVAPRGRGNVTLPASMTVSPLLPFIGRLGVAVRVNRTLQSRRYPIHAPDIRARPEVHSRESHVMDKRCD
jgi:hypothetical protein